MSAEAGKFYDWISDGLARVPRWVDEQATNFEALAWILDRHRRAKAEMLAAEGVIEAAVITAAPAKPKGAHAPIVEGVGVVKVTPPTTKKQYDQARLVSVAAARLTDLALAELIDPEEGTMPPPGALVEFVCGRMAELTGATAPSFTGWRSKVATELGIDLDTFRDEVAGAAGKVVIT